MGKPLTYEEMEENEKGDVRVEENDEYDEEADGTEEEQLAFVQRLENFYQGRHMEWKNPKFYGKDINCLKLWNVVMALGGHEEVTSLKLWRQVGSLFNPPETCTTVAFKFRNFYEKALLEYEKFTKGAADQDANKNRRAREKAVKQELSSAEKDERVTRAVNKVKHEIVEDKIYEDDKIHEEELRRVVVIDEDSQADWVKISIKISESEDAFEVYGLVPGFRIEEINIKATEDGRLVISGKPEQPVNPWGITPFTKVIKLPRNIKAHEVTAMLREAGKLFVNVPLEKHA